MCVCVCVCVCVCMCRCVCVCVGLYVCAYMHVLFNVFYDRLLCVQRDNIRTKPFVSILQQLCVCVFCTVYFYKRVSVEMKINHFICRCAAISLVNRRHENHTVSDCAFHLADRRGGLYRGLPQPPVAKHAHHRGASRPEKATP